LATNTPLRCINRCLALSILLVSCVLTTLTEAKTSTNATRTGSYTPSNNLLVTLNLRDFGATGNGTTNDGPALQAALDALANAGGGTLFVPAGRYAIVTSVFKDFSGLAQNVTIQGVESSTPVPPPTAPGEDLSQSLDLVSEFYPRTGTQQALSIKGLQSFLIKDLAFVGTPNINSDAAVTLNIDRVEDAVVSHCEFYGLATQADEGAIVKGIASRLTIERSVFLGCTARSALNTSVVQNSSWKGITVTEAVFIDYGQRPELFTKTNLSPALSWINISNAAPPDHNFPRREISIKSVFLDEGAIYGITSVPNPSQVTSAPIDLLYITGLFMNVSNLNASGHHLADLKGLLIENSHYGWSQRAENAIDIINIDNAILDRIECVASADRIRADATTDRLTVINSIYDDLESAAQITTVIDEAENDPVEYVRRKFTETLGREPDPAGHFFWSDKLLQCNSNAQCETAKRTELADYLTSNPQPNFAITGRLVSNSGAGMPGVTVTLAGSQSVVTQTDTGGRYSFSNLPTSGVYTVTTTLRHHTISPASFEIVTPAGDKVLASTATINHHDISGSISDANGSALSGVTVTLSGSQNATVITSADGSYSFEDLPAGGDYVVQPSRTSYAFTPTTVLNDLDASHQLNFVGTFVTFTIGGRVSDTNNQGIGGITLTLSGSQSRTTTSDASGLFEFTGLPSERNYTVTPSAVGLTFNPVQTIYSSLDSDKFGDYRATVTRPIVEFAAASLSTTEGVGVFQIVVTRSGETSEETTIRYSVVDGTAQQGDDLNTVIGELTFAPGEVSKVITLLITDDTFVEGAEHLSITLSDPEGATLGSRSSATITITDNDSSETISNPIDDARFFVRQQYRDFLNREPDQAGLDFWANQIIACGTNPGCLISTRQHVSAAFFLSIEFTETGFLAHRLYKAAYGRAPRRVEEFLFDTRIIGENLIVGTPGWEQLLEANKVNFLTQFVESPEFVERYPSTLTPAQFVEALNANTGSSLTSSEVAAVIAEFGGAADVADTAARQRAIRKVAENPVFVERETRPAFVRMQYFGYLQRNPDDPPDSNLDGYNFWLDKLNQFNGNWEQADMVRAFIESIEYRSRFGR
jgi:Calx-beta domain-containing protein/carboxypeptidase family protein/pectate lyase-like protein/uncharacterized protein DUF4214